MFARMLATEADLALLDEPTAAMDMVAESDALQQLASLAHEHDMAVVCISHALNITEKHVDDILLLDRATGEIVFDERDRVLEHAAYQRLLRGEKTDAS